MSTQPTRPGDEGASDIRSVDQGLAVLNGEMMRLLSRVDELKEIIDGGRKR